jgi:hypothetical protein
MKKNYFLLPILLLTTSLGIAQESNQKYQSSEMVEEPVSAEEMKYALSHQNQLKAAGDTLFYEDFGTGFSTNGWVAFDAASNGFNWIYTTQAPGGQYAATVPAIPSTTSANGFASLPSSFYNTPTPPSWINMDAYLTSGPIVITPVSNVLVRWQQSQRFCCASTSPLELSVSNDNLNWTAFDARFGRGANTAVVESAEINISSIAANQDTIYLRWYQGGSRNYYWMIDDIAVVEGAGNQLITEDAFTTFGTDFREGFYTQVPVSHTNVLGFNGVVKNDGGFNATNVALDVKVEKGSTVVFQDSSLKRAMLPIQVSDTFDIPSVYQNTDGQGDYTITYTANSDSTNADQVKAIYTIPYKVSDTVFAKDYDNSGGTIGPGSYVDGDADGSRIGTKFNVQNSMRLNSVSYYISNLTANVGIEIKAKVWGMDTSQTSLDAALNTAGIVGQNPIPYIITAADLGTWVTIRMLPMPVLLSPGYYVAAIEQSAGNANLQELRIGRARDSEEFQPYGVQFSSMVYASGAASPSWGNIFAQPMIRMNLLRTTLVDEKSSSIHQFNISPNPTNGQFKLDIVADQGNYELSVTNIVGQEVYTENVSISNTLTKTFDLSTFDKGMYFITLNNGTTRKVEKVILK